MEDLILQLEHLKVERELMTPLENLRKAKHISSRALIETKPDYKLDKIYLLLEDFNIHTKENVSFDPDIYSDNYILQIIVRHCSDNYEKTFHGSYRERILNCLLFYENMIMCIPYEDFNPQGS